MSYIHRRVYQTARPMKIQINIRNRMKREEEQKEEGKKLTMRIWEGEESFTYIVLVNET